MALSGRVCIWALFTINVVSAALGNLSQTAVNVMMTDMCADLGVGVELGQWLTTVYMLVIGIVVPVTTFLDRRLSSRQYILVALSFFAAGALADAVGTGFAAVLAGRVLQAISTGILLPNTQNIVMRSFAKDRQGTAMGISGIAMGFAPNIGPTVGSWFMHGIGWRWFFALLLALAALSAALVIILLPKSAGASSGKDARLNPVSFALSALGFGGILLGLSNATSFGVASPLLWAPLASGSLLLVAYLAHERRTSNPLIDMRIFASRRFAAGFWSQNLHWGSFMGITLVIPLFISGLQGGDAADAGIVLLPAALIALICNPLGGMLADRFGPIRIIKASTLTMAVGAVLSVGFDAMTPIWLMTLVQSVRAVGISTTISPLVTWTLRDLPGPLISSGSSFSTLARQACASLGTAAMVFCMEGLPALGIGPALSCQLAFGLSAAGAIAEAVLAWTLASRVDGQR